MPPTAVMEPKAPRFLKHVGTSVLISYTQNILGNLVLKGCQSRSTLGRLARGSEQFIKQKASELLRGELM